MAVDWPEMINADKPSLWKPDIERSVQLYNEWFLRFAPRAYRRTRKSSISQVRRAFAVTRNLREINQHILAARPAIISTLRMATSPPLARDRLAGLSGASKSLLETMENNLLPPRSSEDSLSGHLTRICEVVNLLMDRDLFPWIDQGGSVQRRQLEIATSVVADRLSGAVADPVIRNAQETHQLRNIGRYLLNLGYRKVDPISVRNPLELRPGTFAFRLNLKVGKDTKVKLPIDAAIQPLQATTPALPLLIEAKSAGDYTNTNKRRKEEATKNRQLSDAYGSQARLILFLRGYFDAGYLGYEAAEGLDWVWEHRIEDLRRAGI